MTECYFTPNKITTSTTICANCEKEKMLHTIGEGINVNKVIIITNVKQQALGKTDVIYTPQRVNVFDSKGKLIGQDYQRDNGDWMHKWIDPKTGTFERGSWRDKCKGEDMQNWSYEDCI